MESLLVLETDPFLAWRYADAIQFSLIRQIAVDSFDGPDNAPLVIIANTPVQLGVLMDFATAGQGTLDEVRMSGTALGLSGLLVPEPSNALLVGLGLVALSARRRRSR